MNVYSNKTIVHFTNGESTTRSKLQRLINAAKDKKLEERAFDGEVCEVSNQSGMRIHMMHIVSVKECIELGAAEYAAEVNNLLMASEFIHGKWDKHNAEALDPEHLAFIQSRYDELKEEIKEKIEENRSPD